MYNNYNSLQYKRRNSRKYNSVEHHYFSIPELEQLLSLESSLNEEQLNRQSWQEYWNWYVVLDFFFFFTYKYWFYKCHCTYNFIQNTSFLWFDICALVFNYFFLIVYWLYCFVCCLSEMLQQRFTFFKKERFIEYGVRNYNIFNYLISFLLLAIS